MEVFAQFEKNSKSIETFIQKIAQYHETERKEEESWTLLKLEFLLFALRDGQAREKLANKMTEN